MGKSTSQTEKRSSWQRRPFLLIVVVLLVVWWLWGASARANLEPQRSFTDRIFRTVTFQPIDSPLLSTEVAVNSFMSAHAGDFVGQPGAAGAIGNKGERGDKGDSATTPSIGNTRPTLSFDSSNLGLTILGGNTVDLSVLATDKIDDADSSPLNEIQSATVGGGLFLGADSSVGLIRTCSSNQVLKWDGSAWACSVSTAGGAIALDDLTDVTIASPVSGSTLKYNGSEWVVGNDTDTTYSAAGGLSLVGTTFSLDSSLGVFKTIDTR